MQQVLHIHGGDPHQSYKDYISFLKSYVLEDLEQLKRKKWKESLQEKLGSNFDVIAPKMPNDRNAKYLEWKIWFDKILPFLNDGVILSGGSLGGIFLTKYLSENTFPKRIKGVFLVAAPFGTKDAKYPIADFILPESLNKLVEQGGEIHFYHSKDDPMVPFEDMEKYKAKLPNTKFTVFEDRGHFAQSEFPELIKDIRNLS